LSLENLFDQLMLWRCVTTPWRLLRAQLGHLGLLMQHLDRRLLTLDAIGCWLEMQLQPLALLARMLFWVRRQQQLPSLEVQEQAQCFDMLALIQSALLYQQALGDAWGDLLALLAIRDLLESPFGFALLKGTQ
jgi:hypothetical protein